MLRFVTRLGLLLCAGLTLVGGLLVREWGWPEYTAPALYLIHWQQVGPRGEWRILPASGGANMTLTLADEPLLALDCAPDGRTLAVLGADHRVRVLTAAGVVYERAIDPAYDALTVANDGRVTLYDPALGGLRLDAAATAAFDSPPDIEDTASVAVGADGWQLWNSTLSAVQLVTPAGELIRTILPVSGGRWLANERIIGFGTLNDELRQYLMTTVPAALVTLHQAPGVYAPDGLTRAVALRDEAHGSYRTYIGGAFGNAGLRPIPRDTGASDWPVCWLTFWPGIVKS